MNSPLILVQKKNLTVRLYFGLCGGDFLAIITAVIAAIIHRHLETRLKITSDFH